MPGAINFIDYSSVQISFLVIGGKSRSICRYIEAGYIFEPKKPSLRIPRKPVKIAWLPPET